MCVTTANRSPHSQFLVPEKEKESLVCRSCCAFAGVVAGGRELAEESRGGRSSCVGRTELLLAEEKTSVASNGRGAFRCVLLTLCLSNIFSFCKTTHFLKKITCLTPPCPAGRVRASNHCQFSFRHFLRVSDTCPGVCPTRIREAEGSVGASEVPGQPPTQGVLPGQASLGHF